ncbi:hypothetical protein [Curtobacterium sp. PhB136]|uniref:hypothetical protein n=1 Tax=Curtobacterium sp. PhB136 TaxID=2485181 RepID=UPI0010507336|nr:hypothetical protein [Curtobacterium sp. PhB136]TCK59226.1 hypothetical protein EDF27_3745 [Curtobacterium sp. PhB136]
MAIILGVRFRPDDLPRFAGELFASVVAGGALPAATAEAIAALAESGGGAVDVEAFDAAELLAYVLAVVDAEARLPDDAFTEHVHPGERRARVEEAVRRLVGYRA